MFFARYWLAILALAIAGAVAAKKTVPKSAGTLPTDQRPIRDSSNLGRLHLRRTDLYSSPGFRA